MSAFLKFAEEAAQAGGKATLPFFRADTKVETKQDGTPVTQADRTAEQVIRSMIEKAFPEHAIHGEEFGDSGGDEAVYRWVVDPIDGTKNFVRGIPFYATLVALEKNGKAIVGACFEPQSGTLVSAEQGQGAWRNGEKINVSEVAQAEEAMVVYSGDWAHAPQQFTVGLRALENRCAYVRGYGDYLGHLYVASGRSEIMMDPSVKPEDVAAVKIIVEEAGGKMTDFQGNDTHLGGSAVSSNKKLHRAALDALAGK